MEAFIFRCPITRQNVQGSIAEEVVEHADAFVPVQCTACRQFHHVNVATRRVLGGDDDEQVGTLQWRSGERRAANLQQRATDLKKLAEAWQPLYQTLTADQAPVGGAQGGCASRRG